jgi:hypothetical protein
MGSLSEFSKRIKVIADSVERGGPKVAREAAALILQTVVMATPVGNTTLWSDEARRRARPGYVGGRARANWQVGIGEAPAGVKDDVDATGGGTISAGRGIIGTANKGPVEIHITNNLPYIVPLNEGHSKQAPAGFVELAVTAAIDGLSRMKVME